METRDPNNCPCCGNPWLLCPKAKKAALDGRIASSYPTMRVVEVGNDQARSVPLHFRVVKGKR